jgi:hypothetical protein
MYVALTTVLVDEKTDGAPGVGAFHAQRQTPMPLPKENLPWTALVD